MLIVPVSGQPDWRRPPLILLLLILINVLVFFGAQGRDDERTLHAARYYFDSALPGIELPRYVAELERHRPADALPLQKALDKKRPQRVLRAMENDAAFMRRLHAEQIVTPEAPEFARWRSERRHYETLRDNPKDIRPPPGVAQKSLDPGQQLRRGKRLDDVVIRAQLQPAQRQRVAE